ncbi:MAG: 2'-deoxycytidine 5'-triphosphate deaminase domain-containing protein [Candidatus Woesearchaeota archaeon]
MVKTLTDKELPELIKKDCISSSEELEEYIQPASIDIPLGNKAYHLQQKFIPFSNEIHAVAEKLCIEKIDLNKGTNLYKGQTYLIKCLDINLPQHLSGVISPKSSIGRIDLRVRSIVDNHYLYDTIEPGKKGELWLEVTPRSFNVKVKKGIPLAQLRIIDENEDSTIDFSKQPLVIEEDGTRKVGTMYRGRLVLSLNVEPGKIIGYEAKSTDEIIDLSKKGALNPKKFFRELVADSRPESRLTGKFVLEKDRFYILSTKELVAVPEDYSLEMVSIDPKLGDLTVHYAGFFDPGFGMKKGANGVLEVRPHEVTTVYHGQPICLMECFENKSAPTNSYGASGNNYQYQRGPRLSKYFKQD